MTTVAKLDAIDLDRREGATWTHIDVALRTIAKRRGALDALEAKWLREGLRVRIWREVGCVSMSDYLERRLGYSPRTARDRVRIAMALAELPKLEAALENGLPHSAVRELTRVCTNDNEQAWLDKVRGKTVHEIENLVAGKGRGANPEDPSQPDLVGRTMTFEAIKPSTEALARDVRRAARDERGTSELSDDELLAMLFRRFLEGGTTERTKAPFQVAVSLCERCGTGWQESGGRKYALSAAELERACCDSERIGSLDASVPERATQDVPPSVRRKVQRRDRGRCRMPGCRSTRCLEVHHIVARILGGSHDAENLILLCDGCHSALHRGLISISGTSSDLVVTRRHEISYDQLSDAVPANDSSMEIEMLAHVGHGELESPSEQANEQRSPKFERQRLRADARSALVGLGFRPGEAGKAVDLALERFEGASLEELIRQALRSFPRN